MLTFGHKEQVSAFRKCVSFVNSNQAEIATNVDEDHPFAVQVQRFAAGERERFSGTRLDLSHLTEFQQRVVKAVKGIGYGKTLSYGEVADKAGSPRAARAVGNVMRSNRTPLIVPCHRVVASTGIGGFSAAEGVSMKRRLLALEGN